MIQNKGIGHTFIPEQRDIYEAWVDFAVKDGDGRVLYESGFIRPDGNLDPSAHSFTSRLVNAKGELNDLHQVWHSRALAYDNSLQPGRSQLVRYRFQLPRAIKGHFTLTAAVRYRRFNQHFIDFAMATKHYPEPIVEVASETRTFAVGNNRSVPVQSGENLEWMRWNNYGIALLDAQQYKSSSDAFARVAELRPHYADAYTNIAIVEIVQGHYYAAKMELARALSLLPGDPRALYYRAIVERNVGKTKEAIADFKAELVRYPRSRDGLRELGSCYLDLNDYRAAQATYQRLQEIDPNDLAAHKALATIYRRLGERDKSEIESAKYADEKDDQSASVYAVQFLGKHPEVAAEAAPWHIHDLTSDPAQYPPQVEYHHLPTARAAGKSTE